MNRDTLPVAERVQAEVLRQLGPSRRAEIAFQMSGEARALAKQRLRRQHPGAETRADVDNS
jgi:hypothetical protein